MCRELTPAYSTNWERRTPPHLSQAENRDDHDTGVDWSQND